MVLLTGHNRFRAAVFISGTGSNLKSLIKFSKSKKSPISINLIISNNSKAKGLNYAKRFKIKKKILNLKNEIKYTKNINQFLKKTKKDFEKFFNIKIEYLENRNTNDLSLSNKYNGSKIFLAYYYKNVRLIDNF